MPKLFSGLKTAAPLPLAGVFLRLFQERGCIAEACSSCVTPDGGNLIAGGMIWIVPAVIFSLTAPWQILLLAALFLDRK